MEPLLFRQDNTQRRIRFDTYKKLIQLYTMKKAGNRKTTTVHINIPEDLYLKLERRSAQIGKAVDEIVHLALRRDLRDALNQSGEF